MRTFASAALVFTFLAALPGIASPQPPALHPALQRPNWRFIGPTVMGGRIDDVAVVEKDPSTAYVATASGGLWKTTNHGTTFRSIFDAQPTQTIGAVAVSQSNPDVVWVGTGEANNRQSSSWGMGVFRSTDAGATWTHVGLADTHHISRVVVDPRDPDTAYVAAMGHLWGPNTERGVFKTTDGGKTWTKALYVNEYTGCNEVAVDPVNPSNVYAAMYQRQRAAHGYVGGGAGSGIFKSTDGGASWRRLTNGMPDGPLGNIGLDVYRKDPRILCATVEAREGGGVMRSDDAGETWRQVGTTNPRPMYFSVIRIDPTDDRRLWLAGVNLATSTDGGATFRSEPRARLHADIHAIWIDPANPSHMLVGCDGGIQWSWDRGQTWDNVNTLPLAQFYTVGFDMRRPYWVGGGLQDNGTWIAPSTTTTAGGGPEAAWQNINSGDGFYTVFDPVETGVVYCESQNGAVARVQTLTGERKSIRPRPAPGEAPYRFDWNTPIALSPHDHRKVLLGGNRVFISTDRGDTWRRSEDLTTKPDLAKMPIMGTPYANGAYLFGDIPSTYGQVVTLAESPARAGVLYAGTDDGNLQVSQDDGKTWRNVADRLSRVPKGAYVSRVHPSPHTPGRVYVAWDHHRADDQRPYVMVSEDFGETWRDISAGLPDGAAVNVVRDHPRAANLLFVGTERGLFVSLDRGATWARPANLPPLRIDDIQVHPRENDLILGTHSRGVAIMDDIGPWEAASAAPVGGALVTLVQPRTAVAYRMRGGMSTGGNRQFSYSVAPAGALISYFVHRALAEGTNARLEILSADGRRVVRRLADPSTAPGLHRVTWDLQTDAPAIAPAVASQPAPTQPAVAGSAPRQRATTQGATGAGRTTRAGRTGQGGGTGRQGTAPAGGQGGQGGGGPRLGGVPVAPGSYRVRLTVGDVVQTQPLAVEEDPRLASRSRELRPYYAALERLGRLAVDAAPVDARLAALATGVAGVKFDTKYAAAPADIKADVEAVEREIAALQRTASGAPPPAEGPSETEAPPPTRQTRGRTGLMGRAVMLSAAVEGITEPPSRAAQEQVRALERDVRSLARAVRALADKRVPPLDVRLKAAGLTPVVRPPVPEP